MSGDLLNTLIVLSEKAANIARICRQDKYLLSLLVQEKTGDEKNPRFVHDFKTFADVLVQEVVKHHVEAIFPNLKGNILGEENNTFKKGDSCITVEVKATESETEQLLFSVLQDKVAAEILSKEVHKDISTSGQLRSDHTLPDNIAIWIDPIDSTAEYIQGKVEGTTEGISRYGVRCVTVLIGVFCRDNGQPLLGVINQPFYALSDDNRWSGRCFYGISFGGINILEPAPLCDSQSKVVVLSSSEKEEVKNCLINGGYDVVEAAGAGYKGLAVVTGSAQAYILSKGSTFPWDICAVHALLCAAGGGIVDFKTRLPLTYSDQPKPNSGGLIAYRDASTLEEIIKLLDSCS